MKRDLNFIIKIYTRQGFSTEPWSVICSYNPKRLKLTPLGSKNDRIIPLINSLLILKIRSIKRIFNLQNGRLLGSRRLTTLWNSIENFFLKRYFVENLSLNRKTERKMYGPEHVFEIFNFEWKHVLTFLSENMAKMQFAQKKIITQKRIKLLT